MKLSSIKVSTLPLEAASIRRDSECASAVRTVGHQGNSGGRSAQPPTEIQAPSYTDHSPADVPLHQVVEMRNRIDGP